MQELKGKEAIFRSKSKWIKQGEKPTKYFFNLEKKNYVMKTLLQIKPDNSDITSDQKQINQQIETFFSETYKSRPADIIIIIISFISTDKTNQQCNRLAGMNQ